MDAWLAWGIKCAVDRDACMKPTHAVHSLRLWQSLDTDAGRPPRSAAARLLGPCCTAGVRRPPCCQHALRWRCHQLCCRLGCLSDVRLPRCLQLRLAGLQHPPPAHPGHIVVSAGTAVHGELTIHSTVVQTPAYLAHSLTEAGTWGPGHRCLGRAWQAHLLSAPAQPRHLSCPIQCCCAHSQGTGCHPPGRTCCRPCRAASSRPASLSASTSRV